MFRERTGLWAWFDVRGSEGLALGSNTPLLCSPMEGGRWAKPPLTVTAAMQWLRTLVAGATGPPLHRLGTQSEVHCTFVDGEVRS